MKKTLNSSARVTAAMARRAAGIRGRRPREARDGRARDGERDDDDARHEDELARVNVCSRFHRRRAPSAAWSR